MESRSIALRPVRVGDEHWIHEACQDRDIQRWTQVPRPYTLEHAHEFVGDPSRGLVTMVIEDQTSGEPLGMISIHTFDQRTRCADIGYWIDPGHRRRGVASSAVRLIVDLAVARFGAHTVIASIARDNSASRRVVESVGFVHVEDRLGPAVEDLVPVPTCTYRLDDTRQGPPATRTSR